MPNVIMPNFSVPPPASEGLLIGTAVAQGLNSAVGSFWDRKQKQEQKNREDALLQMKAEEQGLLYDRDTGEIKKSPGWQSMKARAFKEKLWQGLPEDWRVGSPIGRKMFNELSGSMPEPQGGGLLQNPGGQGLIPPQPESPAPGTVVPSTPRREPQGMLDREPQGAVADSDFDLLPGYKTKAQREIEKAVEREKATYPISHPYEKQKLHADWAEKLQKDLDPDSSRTGNFGQISNQLIQSQKLQRLARDFAGGTRNLNQTEMADLAMGTASLFGRGTMSDTRFEHLMPNSVKGNLNKFKSWWLNEATPLDQKPFIEAMLNDIDIESELAAQQMKEIQLRRLSRHSGLKQAAPDLYYSILDDYGITPEEEKSRSGRATKGGKMAPMSHGAKQKTAKEVHGQPGKTVWVDGAPYTVGKDGDELIPQ